MIPVFAHPAGLWLLLGVPAILAIHFLQQRSRLVRTSTWFLIEKLAPDSARGRTWDRLRSSRSLWLQIAAVLVATWVLADPRWIQADSAQTVVLVLDSSASMDAFRTPAAAAAEREMSGAEGLAARTTWVVMTTNPRQPPLYRGLDRMSASAAVARWRPDLGRHDVGPALRLARALAGTSGRTLLITDRREQVPPDQRAVGVGRPIENVGFAGATISRDERGHVWRALVKNHAATHQQRSWHAEWGGSRSPEQTLSIAPGAITEISAPLPDGIERFVVVLSADGFAADDRLPLLRPAPKPLSVAVSSSDDTGDFFRRLAADVPGVTVVDAAASATLHMSRVTQDELARERRGGIFWPPPDERAQVPLMVESVTPERDPLVAGLNWQGWLGAGPHGFIPAPGDDILLWHGKWPLVFVRPAAASAGGSESPAAIPAAAESRLASGRKLVLGFDWATSNAGRLPAFVLLVRRFIEAERDARAVAYADNFDCRAPVPLAATHVAATAVPGPPVSLRFDPAAGGATQTHSVAQAELGELRAPGRAGFFTVLRGDELLVRGSAQFADARQGDFRSAERFVVEVRGEREAAIERNTRDDPFVMVWLVLLVGLVVASWWTRDLTVQAAVHRSRAAA